MCGIAGIHSFGNKPIQSNDIQKMCDLMKHRGPDDVGLKCFSSTGLGHRRLSIIDLTSNGRNPMCNEDETIWIVCNGEIYNYRELQLELKGLGHRFRSQTDTEVILHLYEENGLSFLSKLNGMFAFALWDERKRRLVLARDRFGVKPLYYTSMNDSLVFASEVKAFLALQDFKVKVNLHSLSEYLTFQNIFLDKTLFQGVHLLLPGHYLLCENKKYKCEKYWDLHFQPKLGLTMGDWCVGLRERFETAVKRQLMSDVPLGTYLSGGMDTGAISAVAVRTISHMHTFTCGFSLPQESSEFEQFFDEREESRMLARQLNTVHHTLELTSDSLRRVLPQVVWHMDYPLVGISYQVYCTAEMIRKYVTVVLSGVGGDELFAGYPWRYEPIIDLERRQFEVAYYRYWNRLLTDEEKQKLFTDEVNAHLNDFSTLQSFRTVFNALDDADNLHRALYFDFKTFLNGLLLVDDKLNMAHSVEGRVPFLDNDLVEFVTHIPSQFKLQPGKSKAVLREAMRGLLPKETVSRRKQGFTPPDRTWYKKANLGYVRDLILSPRALQRGYFRRDILEKTLDDHLHDRRDNRFLIWSLMCFEWWNRLFIDNDTRELLHN
jgi:asparagine synthase (glutamine-hydrolysing)